MALDALASAPLESTQLETRPDKLVHKSEGTRLKTSISIHTSDIHTSVH